MPIASPNPSTGAGSRVASVDVLRALIIALMVFVNDIAGASRASSWLHHAGIEFDGMTLPDFVFPAFLFIAGMSVPLALGRQRASGASTITLLGRVLQRVLALLCMGVVMVSGEEHEPWVRGLWTTLAFVAMFLAFAVQPKEAVPARSLIRIGRPLGWLALAVLVLLHTDSKGNHIIGGPLWGAGDTVWLRHSWWGILGLIGWAYLAASLVYLFLGRRREWLVLASVLLALFFVAGKADMVAHFAGRPWLSWARPVVESIGSVLGAVNGHVGLTEALGTLAALSVAGACLGSILLPDSGISKPSERLRWAFLFAGGLFITGVLLDAPHGVSKIRATPAWVFYCASLTTLMWCGLYWLIDLKGKGAAFAWLQPAGANPLMAYLLHPLISLTLWSVLGSWAAYPFVYHEWAPLPTALGSLAMSLLVIWLTGRLAKWGFRLRV